IGDGLAIRPLDTRPGRIQRLFGNINPDPRQGAILHSGTIPSLRMRARIGWAPCSALAAVRANNSRPITITLGYGVRGAKGCSICDRPPGTIFFAGLRSPAKTFAPSLFQDITVWY